MYIYTHSSGFERLQAVTQDVSESGVDGQGRPQITYLPYSTLSANCVK